MNDERLADKKYQLRFPAGCWRRTLRLARKNWNYENK
jgi:hypothetical protein